MRDFKGTQRVITVVALAVIAGLLFSISRTPGSQQKAQTTPSAGTPTEPLAEDAAAAEAAPVEAPPSLDQNAIVTSASRKSGSGAVSERKNRIVESGVADGTAPVRITSAAPPEPRDTNGIAYTRQPNAAPVTAALPAHTLPAPPEPPSPAPPNTFVVPDGTSFRVRFGDPADAATDRTGDASYRQRAYPLGYIAGDARLQANREQMMGNRPSTAQHSPPRASAVALGSSAQQWTLIGPQPTTYTGTYTLPAPGYLTSGRVTALAVDPGNANVVYLGGSDGGVWRTTDGGSTWIPLTDNQPSLSVGAIALDPSNSSTIYVGTGEYYGLVEFGSYYGAGVLKSTDGGTTWTQLGASLFGTPSCPTCGGAFIGSLAVHPTLNQVLLAAAAQTTSAKGIFRSTDG